MDLVAKVWSDKHHFRPIQHRFLAKEVLEHFIENDANQALLSQQCVLGLHLLYLTLYYIDVQVLMEIVQSILWPDLQASVWNTGLNMHVMFVCSYNLFEVYWLHVLFLFTTSFLLSLWICNNGWLLNGFILNLAPKHMCHSYRICRVEGHWGKFAQSMFPQPVIEICDM